MQAEQFMLALADVPAAAQRAQGLSYQVTFDESVKSTYARINVFQSAIDQFRRASRLQRFLKATLVLGNKMNGVTKANKKQLVRAFTVNSLHQLYLTKAFDQQTSVLQYLIKLLKRKDPDLLHLSQDFPGPSLAEAKRLPLEIMNEEMRELRAGLTALENVVREVAQQGEGWTAMNEGGGEGPMYVEEEVPDEDGGKAKSGSGAAGGAGDDSASTAADPSEGGSDSVKDTKPKKKKVRRRVEPLPEFASTAQTELSKLEASFNSTHDSYNGELLRVPATGCHLCMAMHGFIQG